MASATQTSFKNLRSAHSFLKLIQTRLEQLLTRWHSNALEFASEWPFRIEGIYTSRMLSLVLALSAVQVLDYVFLDESNRIDHIRTRRLFVLQLLALLAHTFDELAPIMEHASSIRGFWSIALDILYSREGAKAWWLFVNLVTSIAFAGVVIRITQCKPLLLTSTLALANASAAYFVKSVVVDSTHFDVVVSEYNLNTLAHPLMVYLGYATYGFNVFFCAVYKSVPHKRLVASKMMSLTSCLSLALLGFGATLGAYCKFLNGLSVWTWDHIECNALLFSILNLLTLHLNKIGGPPRDSVLGFQILACPLCIMMVYAIHHDMIPTSHGIGGPFGRGGILAIVLCAVSAVFVMSLVKSLVVCVFELSARVANPPYGLVLACALFVIAIITIMAYAIFDARELCLICSSVVVLASWFGSSVLAFDLGSNKHSFGLAVLVATIVVHITMYRRCRLAKLLALSYYGLIAIKQLYRFATKASTNIIADLCHFSGTSLFVCSSLSQISSSDVWLAPFHSLVGAKAVVFRAVAFKLASLGVVRINSNGVHAVVYRCATLFKLGGVLLYSFVTTFLVLFQVNRMSLLDRLAMTELCAKAALCLQRVLAICESAKRWVANRFKKVEVDEVDEVDEGKVEVGKVEVGKVDEGKVGEDESMLELECKAALVIATATVVAMQLEALAIKENRTPPSSLPRKCSATEPLQHEPKT